MRCLLNLVLLLAVLVAAVVLTLGYLGFVPAVAGVVGSNKPRDLEVKAGPADLQSAVVKAGLALSGTTPSPVSPEKPNPAGQPVNVSFTTQELTALMASGQGKLDPVSDTQIKIDNDGAIEVSGLLRLDHLQGFVATTGVPVERVNDLVSQLSIPAGNPPFYARGTLSVENDRVSANLQQVEIGRLPVPSSWTSDHQGAFAALLEARLKQVRGLSVKSLTFANGTARFEGTLPGGIGEVHN